MTNVIFRSLKVLSKNIFKTGDRVLWYYLPDRKRWDIVTCGKKKALIKYCKDFISKDVAVEILARSITPEYTPKEVK